MVRRRIALALTAVLWSVGCGGDRAEPVVSTSTIPATFARFDTATVVVESDGVERRWPVWLAAEEAQRQRGLMEVTDPDLGGRLGMAFWFSSSTEGGFWMRNTRLPLTIVFVDDRGGVVSIADMVPCPDTQTDCPVTRPPAPYRWALEVPTSRWGEVAIDPGATLRLDDADVIAAGSS